MAYGAINPMGATQYMGAGGMGGSGAGGMGGGGVSAQPPPAMKEEEIMQFIVENVNTILTRSYSLVDFDALQGPRLLQVIADVFTTLSAQLIINFDEMPFDQSVQQLTDFLLKTLGYKPPPLVAGNFLQSIANAETTVVYPMMYWLLKNMAMHRKRVYLARFLQRVEIPEDLRMQDEGVRDLHQHYDGLRNDFISTHKRVDALKEAHADPAEARRKIGVLEQERDRLNTLITLAQKKLSQVPNKDALMASCKTLRAEQEEAAKLAERRVEQQQALISAERRGTEMSNRLQNVRRDMHDGRVDSIVRRLRDEIQTNKMKLEEQIPKELNEKRAENAALTKLLSEPLDFQSLHNEMAQLDKECHQLQVQVAERQRPGEDGSSVVSVKQQVQRVVKKKQDILAELANLQADHERIQTEIREKDMTISQFRDSKVLKGEDFRKYSNQVRGKTAATKTMKTRLADLRAEWGVLSYTDKTVQDTFEGLRQEIEDIESRMGIRGYSRTAEELSQVNAQKNNAEQAKGRTLEELSKVVQDFTISIRERRTKLAPQINELRTVRQQANEVEQEWEEKKSQYDYQEGMLMQDVSKIDTEVNQLLEETRVNEALFHRLNAQVLLLDTQVQRAGEEREFASGSKKLDQQFQSYSDLLTRTTEDHERRSKDLQRKRRDVEENHSLHVQQVEWFATLRKILEGKLASVKSQNQQNAQQQNSVDKDIQSLMGNGGNRGGPGVDMLVLGNN
jgi:intraflagellar transport protein 81